MLLPLLTGSAVSSQPATGLVDLVYFVYLVHLVSFVQPNKLNKPNNGFPASCLVPHPEHQIETNTHEEHVGHPAGNQRRHDPATPERDRNRVRCPITEADRERLPNAHRHAASSGPSPAKTQGNANQDHDHGDEGERNSSVVVCGNPCGLRALLGPASGVGPDIMERHQFGIAGKPCGEVIRNEGQHEGLAVECGGRHSSIRRKLSVASLVERPRGVTIACFVGLSHLGQLKIVIKLKETHAA